MIPVSKPRDVYRNLDPLTEKVEIHGEKKYVGTSQDDVLYQRQLDKDHKRAIKNNNYITVHRNTI